VDEGTALAVFLVAWMDGACGKLGGAGRTHLQGLHLIFSILQKSQPLSPLLKMVRKMAVRLDFHFAHTCGTAPSFPPLSTKEMYENPAWIWTSSADVETAQWVAASFALDALMHRACHLHVLAQADRAMNGRLSTDVMLELLDLEIAHQNWTTLPIVSLAESFEQEAQRCAAIPGTQRFLHYDPIRINDRTYCRLLNYWRAIKIYMSLVEYPEIGPGPVSSSRMPIAIQICRTYAALGIRRPNGFRWDGWSLWFAAVAFGGNNHYPLEARWAEQKLDDSGASEIPGLKQVLDKAWDFLCYGGEYLDAVRKFFAKGSY
jgi:hypothetical protein